MVWPQRTVYRARFRLLIALPFLTGGVGLVLFVLVHISLPIAILAIFLLWLITAAFALQRNLVISRVHIISMLIRMIIIAALSTVGYDLTRFAVASVAEASFQPFHVIPIFGHLLTNADITSPFAWAAGWAYHLGNGIAFGIAYLILFPSPGVRTGIAWALGLEAAMASIYPLWLPINSFEEFLTISMIGHLVYGLMLGGIGNRVFRDRRGPSLPWGIVPEVGRSYRGSFLMHRTGGNEK